MPILRHLPSRSHFRNFIPALLIGWMYSGQPGVCKMFIWDSAKPRRDGAMENDIVVHEMTHGITNRMTGGGSGRCLQTTEAGGLGEGWSDTMAEYVVFLLVFAYIVLDITLQMGRPKICNSGRLCDGPIRSGHGEGYQAVSILHQCVRFFLKILGLPWMTLFSELPTLCATPVCFPWTRYMSSARYGPTCCIMCMLPSSKLGGFHRQHVRTRRARREMLCSCT
jgi:hypothetical protein